MVSLLLVDGRVPDTELVEVGWFVELFPQPTQTITVVPTNNAVRQYLHVFIVFSFPQVSKAYAQAGSRLAVSLGLFREHSPRIHK